MAREVSAQLFARVGHAVRQFEGISLRHMNTKKNSSMNAVGAGLAAGGVEDGDRDGGASKALRCVPVRLGVS